MGCGSVGPGQYHAEAELSWGAAGFVVAIGAEVDAHAVGVVVVHFLEPGGDMFFGVPDGFGVMAFGAVFAEFAAEDGMFFLLIAFDALFDEFFPDEDVG